MAADLGLEIVALQPVRDFEAMPDADPRAQFRARGAQIRTHARTRRAAAVPLLQRLGRGDRRSRARRRRSGGARRPRAPARLQHRLRGARLGPPCQGLDGRLGSSCARRTGPISASCSTVSTPACAAIRSSRSRALPAEQDRAGAGRRRAGAADGPAFAQPPLPLLSRPGRLSRSSIISTRDRRAGYRGPVSLEIFNDQFRGASANAIALDGMRSLRAAGRTGRSQARARAAMPPLARSCPPCRRRRASSASSSSNSPPATPTRRARRVDRGPRLQPHRAPSLQGGRSVPAGRDQLRRQPGTRGLRAFLQHAARPVGLRADVARRQRRAKAMERARAMDAPSYVGRIGPGEALIPAVGRRRGQPHLFRGRGRASEWRDDFIRGDAAAPPAR